MVVCPNVGLVHGRAYLPEKSVSFNRKTGLPTKECWRTSWSGEKFLEFITELLESLFANRHNFELLGKKVIFVIDGAPDDGVRRFLKS